MNRYDKDNQWRNMIGEDLNEELIILYTYKLSLYARGIIRFYDNPKSTWNKRFYDNPKRDVA